jgi:hypothetical protein
MAKKRSMKNPRDGRVRAGAADEPAQFVAGSAAPPKNFDPGVIAEACGLWWQRSKGDQFIVRFGEENWSVLNESKVKLHIKAKFKFLSSKARVDAGETLSEMDQVLMHVIEHRRVDGLMAGLAGYKAGVHEFPNGESVIVAKSPHPVLPVKGSWDLVRALIDGRLNLKHDDGPSGTGGGGIDQTEYFHCYLRVVLRSLMCGKPGSWTQRMLLVLAGPTNCGKSRLQKLVTWLLGGREANPVSYLTGQDQFNLNLMSAEHAKMEELVNVSKKIDDRLKLSEALKGMVANEGVTARLMRTDPTTIYPFWVPTLSMNSDPDKMRPFPPLTPDFREKVLMFLVRSAPMPMETSTDEQKEAFNQALRAELPAYVHWLLHEFEPRAELTTGVDGRPARYGVVDFQHPTLAMELFDDTPAAELLMLIDAAELEGGAFGSERVVRLWELTGPLNRDDLEKRNAQREAKGLAALAPYQWEGSALDLERLLLGDVEGWSSSVAKEAKKLFMHNKCDRLLARLKEDQPERVQHKRTKAGRFWIIARPSLG